MKEFFLFAQFLFILDYVHGECEFLGKWYEIKWLPQSYIPPKDLYQDYRHVYMQQPGGTITVYISGRDPVHINICFSYTAELLTTSYPGKFIYKRRYNSTDDIQSDYWVMDTDYDNYAVVYGCREQNNDKTCKMADSWVWSRHQTLNETFTTIVDVDLTKLCLNISSFSPTKQSNECENASSSKTALNPQHALIVMMLYFIIFHRFACQTL